MIRNLRRAFEQVLTLQCRQLQSRPLPVYQIQQQRPLFAQHEHQAPKAQSATNATATSLGTNKNVITTDSDQDYMQPYRVENEKGSSVGVLISALRERFRLNEEDIHKIMSDDNVHRNYRDRSLVHNMDTLSLDGITKRSFIDYSWLLTLDHKRLVEKMKLIKSLQTRDINHFVPFLRLTLPRLRKLVASLNQESHSTGLENRVYYISDRLQVDPSLVTKYLAKRLFILEMPYEMFEQNLKHMIDYNVSPINLLKDLWAFRYAPKAVQLRLERAKRAKKNKIMPWMVRCPEPILQRSLKLSLDELQVLGKFSTVVEYLADRLQFDISHMKAIMDKHPQVHTVRVTKIKEVLDYLIDEAGFSRYEIAQVPRILCHSLHTTKMRMDELKSLGCRPTSLVIVCRSKREYAKFLQHWQSMNTNHFVAQPNEVSANAANT